MAKKGLKWLRSSEALLQLEAEDWHRWKEESLGDTVGGLRFRSRCPIRVQAILVVSLILIVTCRRNYDATGNWGQRQGSFPGMVFLEEAHGKRLGG